MYIADGLDKDYAGLSTDCFSFGWLSSKHEYTTGWPDDKGKTEFIDKIERIRVVDLYRGWHSDDGFDVSHRTVPFPNGSIKFVVDGITYVAPAALPYYIKKLNYRPPEEVIEAIKKMI